MKLSNLVLLAFGIAALIKDKVKSKWDKCPSCKGKLIKLNSLPVVIKLYYMSKGIHSGSVCQNPSCRG